jgi:signal transduction histidine kinase
MNASETHSAEPTAIQQMKNNFIQGLYWSPRRLIAIIALCVFITESLVMVILAQLPDIPARTAVFIDSSILLLFIFPCLNFLVFSPMAMHINERRKVEDALQREHDKLRTILNGMHDLVCMIDQHMRISYANDAMIEELGPAVGFNGHDFFDRFEGSHTDYGTGSAILQTTPQLLHYAASQKIFEVFSTPLHNADGTVATLKIFHDITEQKRAEDQLRNYGEKLRNLSAHLQRVREEERTRIAREIHDELGQTLATLQLKASLMEDALPSAAAEKSDMAQSMTQLIGGAITAVQRICSELRPAMLDDLGLAAAMEWQAQEFSRRTGTPCELVISLGRREISQEVSTALFRIFQETLTNVLRHANAGRVEALLMERDRYLVLLVRDDGRGMSREQMGNSNSLGLLGIRERAGILGGRIRISTAPGKGTTFYVRLPHRRNG